MRFWDASAIIPLLGNEQASAALQRLAAKDGSMLVWWGTRVECASAIARRERNVEISAPGASEAFGRLNDLAASWMEVEPVEAVRQTAIRLLRTHALYAADAFQLSAALIGAEGIPPSQEFVCLDQRLAQAASREGLSVVSDL